MKPKYVFVVGLPRTGTKLAASLVANSPLWNCYISEHTYFLGRGGFRPGVWQKMKKIGDMSVNSNIRKLVDYMYSGKIGGRYWTKLASGELGVDKETMLHGLLNSDRSKKGIYTTLLQIHAEVADNTILGDKSGPHLYHVPTLLEWFPDAKFIHAFRDPRAVLASKHKQRLAEYRHHIVRLKEEGNRLQAHLVKLTQPFLSLAIVLYITIFWLYAVRLHDKYKKLYPKHYHLLKFEDLVTQPEKTVRQLCKFLDIEFDSAMLNPPQLPSSFSDRTGTGLDAQTLHRWKSYRKPWMMAWISFWGKKYLRELGYTH